LHRAQAFGVLELERGAGGGAGYEKGDHAGPHVRRSMETSDKVDKIAFGF
jgi:hypothetical protein